MIMALYEGNPPMTGRFPLQRVSNVEIGHFFVVSLDKLLKKAEESPVIWYATTLMWLCHITEDFPYFLARRICKDHNVIVFMAL